jgi:hypothetical protein
MVHMVAGTMSRERSRPATRGTKGILNMLCQAKTLSGYKLECLDGEIGKVKEFYFDDRYWAIRYLVAATGEWLVDKQVLVSPYALIAVNEAEKHIAIDLTKKQIEDSPSLATDKPVSRQFEEAYYGYYEWPGYWSGPYMWGSYSYIERDPVAWKNSIKAEKAWDHHLRSTHAVTGYHIQASDGEIGHVEDFLIDEETWAIRYLVVATKNWWPGKKILLSPQWIKQISWSDSKVFADLSREAIQKAPEYTADSLVTREYETGLHRHYSRPGYWVGDTVPLPASAPIAASTGRK